MATVTPSWWLVRGRGAHGAPHDLVRTPVGPAKPAAIAPPEQIEFGPPRRLSLRSGTSPRWRSTLGRGDGPMACDRDAPGFTAVAVDSGMGHGIDGLSDGDVCRIPPVDV